MKVNWVNPALSPAGALAPKALLFYSRLSALRLYLLYRCLSAHVRSPEELKDRLVAPLVREQKSKKGPWGICIGSATSEPSVSIVPNHGATYARLDRMWR